METKEELGKNLCYYCQLSEESEDVNCENFWCDEAYQKYVKKVEEYEKKYYRLGYDYLFLANEEYSYDEILKNNSFLKSREDINKNKKIDTVNINLIIMAFDKEGNEFLFESEETSDQRLYFENGNSAYLNNFFEVYYDKENKFIIKKNESLCLESGYDFKYKIESYWGYDNNKDYPFEISEEEFRNILKNETWDNSNNYSTQTTAYFTEDVEINENTKLAKKYLKVDIVETFDLRIVKDNNGTIETIKYIKKGIKVEVEEMRSIAKNNLKYLKEDEFIICDVFENGRKTDSGKLYFQNLPNDKWIFEELEELIKNTSEER